MSFYIPDTLQRILAGEFKLETGASWKLMLLKVFSPASYGVTKNKTAPTALELDCTNYGRGYGGSGRKLVTFTVDTNFDKARIKFNQASIAWAALGGAINDTVSAAALIWETGGSDSGSPVLFVFTFPQFTTDGTDLIINTAVTGDVEITV